MAATVIFADAEGKVVLHCPVCEKSRREPAAHFPSNVPFRVDCPCGASYEIEIEVRKYFRKPIEFDGLLSRIEPEGSSEKISIVNLSYGGCGFNASAKHGLQLGERIRITFTLDDAMKTIIRKEATVRFVKGRYVGCEFVQTAGGLEPDIGFYLWKL
jgi:hypothetical protein